MKWLSNGFGWLLGNNINSNSGTVTSVGVTMPTEFSVSNSPITSSGDIAITWKSELQNLVFASPDSSSGVPTFRSLVATDIPALPYISSTLADGKIWIGSGSNIATAQTLSGDITITNLGVTAIGNNKVTYAKMQGVSTTSKLLGSSSTTTPIQEITLGAGLSLSGTTLTATGTGSVTNVSALTLGTTGTDLSSTVANSTSTPVITLNVPTASDTNRGVLSSSDYTKFTTTSLTQNGWIGMTFDVIDAVVTSSGGIITLTFEKLGGGDVRVLFSTGITTIDCTPALTIALTAGTDTVPQANYVYVLKSAPTVLTLSTTGFPTGVECLQIGHMIVPTASRVATYGVYQEHIYKNDIWDGASNGQINDISDWIRDQNATWVSGTLLTPTLTNGSPDTLTIAVASGLVRQIHEKAYPAFNSATAGTTNLTTFFAVNHPTPYTSGKDLYNFKLTSGNVAAANNNRISWVIWGVIDQYSNESKVFVNLPSGFYTSNAAAIADASHYANYNIPSQYTGEGFLIAKLTYTYNQGGQHLTLVEAIDLRGQIPSIFAGGATLPPTIFPDSTFAVENVVDPTKEVHFDISGNTTAVVSTIATTDTANHTHTIPNATGTIIQTSDSLTITNSMIANTTIDLTAKVTGVLPLANSSDIYFTIPFFNTTVYNPTDGQVIYVGNYGLAQTIATRAIVGIAFDGTLVGASLTSVTQSTLGSAEDTVAAFMLNGGASFTNIFTAVRNNAFALTYTTNSLNVNVSAGDTFGIRLTHPSWATNPVNVLINGHLIFKRR